MGGRSYDVRTKSLSANLVCAYRNAIWDFWSFICRVHECFCEFGYDAIVNDVNSDNHEAHMGVIYHPGSFGCRM